MVLNPSYFEGELTIGQAGDSLSDDFTLSSAVEVFVRKYEPRFYRAATGKKLYGQLIAGLSQPVPEDRWERLREVTAPFAAMFVWYHYMQDNNTQVSGAGVMQSVSESGTPKSGQVKMVRVWNELVDGFVGLVQWVCDNANDYQDFAPDVSLALHCRLVVEDVDRENIFGI